MSIKKFFTRPWVLRRLHQAPLGRYIDNYAARLVDRGYAYRTARTHLAAIWRLSVFLFTRNLAAEALDERIIARFLRHCRCNGRQPRSDGWALHAFLTMLRETSVCPAQAAARLSLDDQLLEDFRRYLLEQRGLALVSIDRLIPILRYFLREQPRTINRSLGRLSAEDVTDFVEKHAHNYAEPQHITVALRTFLRYLQYRGLLNRDLFRAVPNVARWKFSTVPRFLPPDQVRRVLEHCDRRSAAGRRDYAILVMLARLGLRAKEIRTLMLDDIDWHSAKICLRNTKSGCDAQMPLPASVGKALVQYLKNGRPRSSDRHVFLRQQAPHVAFSNSTGITKIVYKALERARVDSPAKGARLFRHSLATQMLSNGASLTLIGQFLRHQDPDTTRIYAKVDINAMRKIALSWPGGVK